MCGVVDSGSGMRGVAVVVDESCRNRQGVARKVKVE